MDFSNRTQGTAVGAPAGGKKTKDRGFLSFNNVLVAAVIVLIVALVAFISLGGPKPESKYVDSSKLQAVFLNTGQVYFGNIKTLNSKYLQLTNIYYLQTSGGSGTSSTQTSNTNVTLVKLGCELHEPFDQMLINRDQVTFWENLQDNGQVGKAVATFEKQNPNGQKCSDQSASSSSNSATSAQPANNGSTTGTTSTTPATTSTKTGQ